jgi:ribulose-5-phosphate 4-epimerase/fuculose-1-phosphate aldolase
VVTFSALRAVPEVYDQESCFLAGEVGIVEEDYGGLASKEERVRPMAEALRKYHAIILPNHGAITRGDNVQQAVFLMLLLEGMAMRHLAVAGASRATGVPARPIAPEVARATKQELSNLKALPLVWEDLMAKLHQTDPRLFAG